MSYYPPGTPQRLKREAHRWANSPLGWIDYAFLGNGSLEPGHRISDLINSRAGEAGSDVVYLPEVSGGRVRPDGQVLKWVISAPEEERSEGEVGVLPFFCGDVTPRGLRVSLSLLLRNQTEINREIFIRFRPNRLRIRSTHRLRWGWHMSDSSFPRRSSRLRRNV